MTTEIVMDEKRKIPGTGRGTGRARGSKNLINGQTKKDVAAFFQDCTTENVRWRQTIKRKLEMAADSNEFIRLTQIALSYAVGKPIPMTPAVSERRSLNFITARGLPWENDPLAQREKEILEAQARDDARNTEQKALEAAGPAAEAAEGEGETLELVREPGR